MYGRVERPAWVVRNPGGDALRVEYDPFRRLWRVEPGGYTRRALRDALADATGARPTAEWIAEADDRLTVECRRVLARRDDAS